MAQQRQGSGFYPSAQSLEKLQGETERVARTLFRWVGCVASGKGPGGHVRPVSTKGLYERYRTEDGGGALQGEREILTVACQVAGICAAGLLVPGYLIDLAFDTDIVTIVAQSMLAAFACALIAMVWNGQKE